MTEKNKISPFGRNDTRKGRNDKVGGRNDIPIVIPNRRRRVRNLKDFSHTS